MNVRVMVFPGAHNLPLWLMSDLEIRYTKSRDEQIAAVQGCEVDVIHTSPDNLLLPDATGLTPFLAGTVGPLHLVALQSLDSPGLSPKQILAVDNARSGFGRLAYQWLRNHAPDLRYEVISVGGTPQRFEALKTNQATMAVMHPPFTQFSQAAGFNVLGRIDLGYPTLCGACREDVRRTDGIETYMENYRTVLEQLASADGPLLAREAFARNLKEVPEAVLNQIAEVMRREIVAAGVPFDPDSFQKLKNLP